MGIKKIMNQTPKQLGTDLKMIIYGKKMAFMHLTELLGCFIIPLPLAFFKGLGFHWKRRIGLFYDSLGSWENPGVVEAGVKNVGFTGIMKGPTQVWLLCDLIT